VLKTSFTPDLVVAGRLPAAKELILAPHPNQTQLNRPSTFSQVVGLLFCLQLQQIVVVI